MTHDEFVQDVMSELAHKDLPLEEIQTAIYKVLHGVDLYQRCQDLIPLDADKRAVQIRRFLACKMVEGCSERTIQKYAYDIKRFMLAVPKPFEEITPDDIRWYLAMMRTQNHVKDSTLNNNRLSLSTFFTWAFANDVTKGNPMLSIKRIRQEKLEKKPFSSEEVEWLRIGCQNDLRLSAIIEIMLSTGCRVAELVAMNRDDLVGDEIVVYGKGRKERRVFLNARARIQLARYLSTRSDGERPMFVSRQKPHNRLKIAGVEISVRQLGRKMGIESVHPHRFRRTAATTALQRGMPIEVVKDMMGHESMNTTLIYAKIADGTVKQAHKRLM